MDSLAKNLLEDFVESANDVIYMKLICSRKDLDDSEQDSFHPEFTHQFFGESESIFGYRGLKILMFYSSSSLQRLISISYKEKVPTMLSKGVEADDILAVIRENIPGNFKTNIDIFAEDLAKESLFRPAGVKLNQFVTEKGESGRIFEVYNVDMSVSGFKEHHNQMQTWLKWFVDAASYIDIDDERWDFFTVYEMTRDDASNGSAQINGNANRYHFVGYCTVYKYFAYPDKLRPRISQFLILPPFQRQGLGSHLLQSIYDHYRCRADVVDITVEDPAENFTKLRDFVDSRNCLSLPEFSKDSLANGWSSEVAQSIQAKLKINRNQARRVYEILKLRITDRSDEAAYRKYRLEVKNRLNLSFLKLKSIQTPVSDEVRVSGLQKLYKQAEEDYLETIEKLAAL